MKNSLRAQFSVMLVGLLLACSGDLHAQVPADLDPDEAAFVKTVRAARPADVRKALEAGAVPSAWALYTATTLYKTEILEMLIEAGGDVNARAVSSANVSLDVTPLLNAAMNGRVDMVKVLLDAGADTNAVCDFLGMEMTPLQAAVMGRNVAVIDMLNERQSEAGAGPGQTAALEIGLAESIQSGDIEAMAAILKTGVDVNKRMSTGLTPLSLAAGYPRLNQSKLEKMVAFLIDHGANVNATNENGSTPLMHAARRGAPGVMKMLLASGADIDARDAVGHHAMHYGDGYDPVSSLVGQSSSIYGSRSTNTQVEDGVTYPPGSYQYPCEKRGSPPGGGVPLEKEGIQFETGSRINGPRGFEAHASGPQCDPVNMSEPGQYSAFVWSCQTRWRVSQDYELRSTEGEVTTLNYTIRETPLCTENTISFEISDSAPEDGKPERCGTARLEITQPADRDQFVFDGEDPGMVMIPLEARADPEDCADEIVWETPDIEGTQKHDSTTGGQDNQTNALVYKGLPESNEEFGPLTLKARMGDQVREVEVQLFFDPQAKNHPGKGAGETPNWFYYWQQTEAFRWGNIAGTDPSYMETIPGCSGGDQTVLGRYVYHDDALYLSGAIFDSTCSAAEGKNSATGIDCYAETLRHEGLHRKELQAWWPIKRETAIGVTVSLGPVGCQTWTGLAASALARYQKWLFREQLGTEERALYHGVDTDLDMVPDAVEDALSARGCDKTKPMSCKGRPMGLDVELNAYTEGWKWSQGKADEEDWSKCGKQWTSGGCN